MKKVKIRWVVGFFRLFLWMGLYLWPVKYVLFALLAYILYNFIFKFVIPVFMATRKIKKDFSEMQSKMHEQMKQQQQQGYTPQPTPSQPETKNKAGDYIDFEEVSF